jgi:hypothetical protein
MPETKKVSVIVALTLLLLLSQMTLTSPRQDEGVADQDAAPEVAETCETLSSVALTWSSLDHPTRSLFVDGVATGYQVMVHAESKEATVTTSRLSIRPYTYQYSYQEAPLGELDPMSDIFRRFDERLAWTTFSGIPSGVTVALVASWDTDRDCDFLAWHGGQDSESYSFANNILGSDMATDNSKEIGRFVWDYPSQSLYIAGFSMLSDWVSIRVDLYYADYSNAVDEGNSVSCPTYYLGENITFDALYWGYTMDDLTEFAFFPDLTIVQFWAPVVTLESFGQVNATSWEVSWSCRDESPYDINLYEVGLSYHSEYFFVPIAENLSDTHYVWDSSGYEMDTYWLRIRAYSVDVLYHPGPYVSIPGDYFPGDYGEAVTDGFRAGDMPPTSGDGWVSLSHPSDIDFWEGTSGHTIVWTINFQEMDAPPDWISYDVFDNGRLHLSDEWNRGEPAQIEVSLDGLTQGLHNMTLVVYNPDGSTSVDEVFVLVSSSSSAMGLSLHQIALYGFEAACLSVMTVFGFLSLQELKRKRRADELFPY